MRKTEPIVQYTLEPLVYEGPAEGWQREQWKLKSPTAILDLKVCDMTMGSGAFLVQACRYLAERLVEAWENAEKEHPGKVLITPDGTFSEGSPAERLVPADASERIAIARRVVADRCLYGVDINPMAVEMAKLSLWLITDLPRLLAEHVADQIVLVEPLHDDDDGATALVIEPAVEGMDEPLVAGKERSYDRTTGVVLRGTESLLTHRWREMDSNLQYRAVKGRFVPSASKGVAPNKTLADANKSGSRRDQLRAAAPGALSGAPRP